MSEVKLYAERDLMGLDRAGNHYCKHILAMTKEVLHAKSDIAAELAFRDFELAALREELAKLKEVTNFKDAVACVFDNLKMVACNTSDRTWDDQLEDLAEDVIEMAPEYKKQWKDIGKLSASLAAAEQRNADLVDLIEKAHTWVDRNNCGGWDAYELRDQLAAALAKTTESGASE